MEFSTQIAPVSKAARWTGYVLSTLPVLMLFMGSFMALSQNPQAVEGTQQMGYPAWEVVPIGLANLVCTILYIIPQTSVLGAILLTGYLGGAVATHVRVEEPQFAIAIVFGVLI